MIKSTTLENFQSHTLSELKFHEGVNVITGASDSGKSSIVRAWYWLINNRPSGEDFKNWKSHKKDQVAVELITDKSTLTIVRADGKTSYSADDVPYSALKTDVPPEISEVLNLKDYNIQTQFQPYFLLQDSPGEVARKLNELVGLDVIDVLYKNLSSEINISNSKAKVKEIQRTEIKKQLEEFKKLDEIEKLITIIEENYQKSLEIKRSRDFLKEMIEDIISLEKEKAEQNKSVKYASKVDKYLLLTEEGLEILEKKNNLKALIRQIEDIQDDIEANNMWVEIEDQSIDLSNRMKTFQDIADKIDGLGKIISTLSSINSQQQIGIKQLDEHKTEYVALLNEEKLCPVCLTKINLSTLKSIKENL